MRDALGRVRRPAAYWSIFANRIDGNLFSEASSGVGLDASALAVVGEEVGAVTLMGTALMLHNAMVCAVQEAYGLDPAVQQHIADLAHGTTMEHRAAGHWITGIAAKEETSPWLTSGRVVGWSK